ncbi:hypothetical protein ES703_25317 [subsurface metagenome]
MNSSASSIKLFHKVYLEEDLLQSALFQKAKEKLQDLPVIPVRSKAEIPAEDMNQHSLFICRPRGQTVTPCPGSRGHICCNYITVDLYLGCPLGCAYCIMKSYLNFSPVTVYLDPWPAIARIEQLARNNADRILRVGTGEVGDSLLLDPLFELCRYFIRSLAPYPNLFFEMKTKTHFVDHLLDLEHKGNAVIGFSLNPQPLITAYEGISSSLDQRLKAARQAAESGYNISFHFDPLILKEDWEASYGSLIDSLKIIPDHKIAWISLGTVRYTPELKEKMGSQDLLLEEFVPCRDGKYRYLQKTRSRIYLEVRRKLQLLFTAPIYLCMESPAVWRNVFGEIPQEISAVRDIFKPARWL